MPTLRLRKHVQVFWFVCIVSPALVRSDNVSSGDYITREQRVVYMPPPASGMAPDAAPAAEASQPVPAVAPPPLPVPIPVSMAMTPRPVMIPSKSGVMADAEPGYGPDGAPVVPGDAAPWMPSSAVWAEESRVIVRPSPYIQNRPSAGDRIDGPPPTHPPQPPIRHPPPPHNGRPPVRPPVPGVTETEMYLIGAMEKLVYKVDFLDKRLRRAEELIRYLLEGAATGQQEISEPCPKDFVRSGRLCLHLSGRDLNWKSASSACKAMDSMLVELPETEDARRRLLGWLYARPDFRGRDFWTGGLNPGLLWIWANSARPVLDSGNMTSPNGIPNGGSDSIRGNGRCLSMAWNPASRLYDYRAADCGARMRFVCQLIEPQASRALRRLQKALGIGLDETPDEVDHTTNKSDDTLAMS